VWASKTKSLLSSLYKREEFPLFGYLFPATQAGKRGWGRFSQQYVFSIMDSLVSIYKIRDCFAPLATTPLGTFYDFINDGVLENWNSGMNI